MSNSFSEHKKIWEENAQKNAMWSILSDPNKTKTQWNKAEFTESGNNDIRRIFTDLDKLKLSLQKDSALDFGCGLGRLSSALAAHFNKVTGVDISKEMVEQARALNANTPNCTFTPAQSTSLNELCDAKFDFILSLMVFQHIPPPYALEYLRSLLNRLKPNGVMVVQIPSHRTDTLKNKLRTLLPEPIFRLKHKLLKSNLPYITMYGISKDRIYKTVQACNASVALAQQDSIGGDDWVSYTYFIKST